MSDGPPATTKRALGDSIRPLGPEDAEATYALRLEGLRRHPEAFLADADEERAAGPLATRRRLERNVASGGEATLFGAFDAGELVGTTGLVRDDRRKRRHRACIVAVYVREDRRGRGIGGRLLDAAIAHARTLPGVEVVYLSTDAGNEAALRAYRSRGFVPWGTEWDALRTEGASFDEVHLQLRLDELPPGPGASDA
jgi:RimJ/RimL family protein N-acetyltransferase